MSEFLSWFVDSYRDTLVKDMTECQHESNNHQEGSVYNHTALVDQEMDKLDPGVFDSMTAVLHDIGKPLTKKRVTRKNGDSRVVFYGHNGLGAYMAIVIIR